MQDGRIAERGTYDELITSNGAFAKFVAQFGGKDEEMKEVEDAAEEEAIEEGGEKKETEAKKKGSGSGKALMQVEERAIGAVSGRVYHGYFKCVSFSFFCLSPSRYDADGCRL